MKRLGILQSKYMKGQQNLWKDLKVPMGAFYGCEKDKKTSGLVFYSYNEFETRCMCSS